MVKGREGQKASSEEEEEEGEGREKGGGRRIKRRNVERGKGLMKVNGIN